MEDVSLTVVADILENISNQEVPPEDKVLSAVCSSTDIDLVNGISFESKEENTQIYNSIHKSNTDQNQIVHEIPNGTLAQGNAAPSASDNFISETLDSQTSTVTESSADTIMSVCSSTAQHIKQTITDVLNSRKEEEDNAALSECCTNSIESSLKEKLADFEIAVMCNFSEKNNESSEIFNEDNSSQILANSEVPVVEELQLIPENSDSEVVTLESSDANLSSKSDSTVNISAPESKESNNCENDINNEVYLETATLIDEKSTKKSQKNSSSKKKGEKTVDQILKSLSEFPTPESKLQNLCKKHSETLEELRLCELRLKQSERQAIQLAREKEQLQAEHNRMILAKSRLESLCRELQRQNKAVKEESLLRIREEEEKRKDVASKFQTTLNEISTLMQDNSKKNLQLKEENAELAQKLKSLVEHYEMWEKHMEKVVQQKDLEAQLAKAKHAKANLQLKEETEKFLREKQSLLENMNELQKKCTQLATNELQLRTELGDYTSKYEEFQAVLNKSNQVFANFKTDMETTSKKIKKLEKETNLWKKKWENSNNALLEMVTDKQKRDKELLNAQQRILTLEKLCRALQSERNDLQNKVKGLMSVEPSQASGDELPQESAEASATVAAVS